MSTVSGLKQYVLCGYDNETHNRVPSLELRPVEPVMIRSLSTDTTSKEGQKGDETCDRESVK